jgi:hypothetical protein
VHEASLKKIPARSGQHTPYRKKSLLAKIGKVEGKGGAKKLLQINPHTLRARMRKLGIHWSKFRPT